MFKYLSTNLHKSKKGFTLMELMVTLILLALLTGMITQITGNIYRNYKMVEDRWEMQNEVHYIMKMFEGNKEALTTSSQADIFYDPEHKMVPADGAMQSDDPNYQYSYFYTEAIDPDNLDAGYNLFYKERGGVDAVQLNDEGTPVNVEFTIPVQPAPLDVGGSVGTVSRDNNTNNEQSYATIAVDDDQKRYQKSTLQVTVISSGVYSGKYSLTTSFTFNNMLANQQINYYMGSPVAIDDSLKSQVSIAGWTNSEINTAYAGSGYPITFTNNISGDISDQARAGNVVRFISAQSFIESSKSELADVSMCSLSVMLSGSKLEIPVKGAMRDFRDNVLAKTDFGQSIISKYYNEWSPAILDLYKENPKLVKAAVKAVAYPAAIVAYFVAD